METKRLKIENKIVEQHIKEAAQLIQIGEVVAFPTETVYGLGADATNELAVQKIFKAKGRPSDNPLIVHVATKEQLLQLVADYPPYVDKLINNFSPGPITYVLKSKGNVAKNVTAGLDTIGVRIPDNEVALAFLQACHVPVAAPSANISGKPSPTTADHVWDDLEGKIAAVLDGARARVGLESTVIDCTKDIPVILRVGAITKQDIEKVIGKVHLLKGNKTVAQPASPGLKYKHYAPDVPLILVRNKEMVQDIICLEQEKGNRVGALVQQRGSKTIQADKVITLGNNEEEIAMNLYSALRSIKKDDLDLVVCPTLPEEKVGKAVMDRLRRAATKIM